MTVFNESVTCGRPRRFHAAHCMSYGLGDEKSLHCTEGSPLLSFERARYSAMACTAIFFYLLTVLIATIGRGGSGPTGRLAFFLAQFCCARENNIDRLDEHGIEKFGREVHN